jgi:hypothetical protein
MAGFNKQWQSIPTPELLKFFLSNKENGLSNADAVTRIKKLGDNSISYFPDVVWGLLQSTLLRDGKKTKIKNNLIALGDIVMLEKNKIVPADIRLIEVDNLSVNQSLLNGSEAILYKNSNTFHSSYDSIFDIKNMVFAGTGIVSGRAIGIVVASGGNSQISKIEKHSPKLSRKQKKANKILKNNGIITNEYGNYVAPKSIDTVIVNFPVSIDYVKELIRVISHQMGKNIIFCTDESTAKRLIAITPGMAHIDKKYFQQKSNKALMEADYPLMSFISVNEADIIRFSKILNIKNRRAICLDSGNSALLASSDITTIVSADTATDESILKASYLVNSFQDMKKIISQIGLIMG